jgi:hypothetical protein
MIMIRYQESTEDEGENARASSEGQVSQEDAKDCRVDLSR